MNVPQGHAEHEQDSKEEQSHEDGLGHRGDQGLHGLTRGRRRLLKEGQRLERCGPPPAPMERRPGGRTLLWASIPGATLRMGPRACPIWWRHQVPWTPSPRDSLCVVQPGGSALGRWK